jgi:hypothetical protein
MDNGSHSLWISKYDFSAQIRMGLATSTKVQTVEPFAGKKEKRKFVSASHQHSFNYA